MKKIFDIPKHIDHNKQKVKGTVVGCLFYCLPPFLIYLVDSVYMTALPWASVLDTGHKLRFFLCVQFQEKGLFKHMKLLLKTLYFQISQCFLAIISIVFSIKTYVLDIYWNPLTEAIVMST